MNKPSLPQFLRGTFPRFVLVGLLNTALGASLTFFCYHILRLGYWLSSAAGYFAGSVFSYFCNRRFTFRCTRSGWRPAARFTLNILLCYLLAYSAARPLIFHLCAALPLPLRDTAALAAGMGLFLILNYFGQRFFAFAE